MKARTPQPGDYIYDLDTPAALVDLDRLERNIRNWQSSIEDQAVKFRPHVKTHKVPEIARMQMRAGASGIVCAKVSEAEPFADAGINDICVAYPVFGEAKWQRVAELAKRVRLTVNCDSEEAARGLSQAASKAGVTIHVQIDVDTGLHRGGIPFEDLETSKRLAAALQSLPAIDFEGITTHRSLDAAHNKAPREAGQEEGRMMVEIAKELRNSGFEVREVTAGSTPTGRGAAEISEITEVRAGTYIFNDLMQLGWGSAKEDELALSILCTVVSHPVADRLTIDAGSKTFSGDKPQGTAGTLPTIVRAVDRKIFVERMTEEHGMARVEEPVKLGEKIRFFPYHVCPCVNLNDQLVGFRGERVEVVWPVRARGLRA